ncbi:MAG TPA: hypothetical protein DCM38_08265 [Gammaproteobacteria bacterium]|nr:hypothetical protein [Gammaproteobacteria bacterium]
MTLSALPNPLPAMWEAFETSESALKVAMKAIRQPHSQKVDCQDELFRGTDRSFITPLTP